MEFNEFEKKIKEKLDDIDIKINEEQSLKFYKYMKFLISWNEKVNLTSIIDEDEIIIKHFADSLTINKYIKENSLVADVGTGAGFPGIPLAIINETIKIDLIDSLNKRINFINEVVKELEINNAVGIHSRIEDIGREAKSREKYDVATSRAVAKLNILTEYMLPLVKIGGTCICMKGPNCDGEIEEAKTAIKKLGGKISKVEKIILNNDNERTIIIIEKIKSTEHIYPRKAGIPIKNPLN